MTTIFIATQLDEVLWRRWLPAGAAAGEEALQCVLKRLPEVPVEVGIDEWIQRRVEVADPEENGD